MIDLETLVAHWIMALAAEMADRHSHQCYWWFLASAAHRQLYHLYICPPRPPAAAAPSDDLRWN